MKKKLVSLVLCMALLSSLTVGASAEFTSTDSSYLYDIYRQVTGNASFSTINDWIKNINANLGYLYSAFSDTRSNVNPIAYYAKSIYEKMSTPKDYSTVLSNIKTNTDTIASYIQTVSSDVAGIAKRIVEVQTLITGTNNRVDTTNDRLSTINTNMQNLIAAASQQNHSDWNRFLDDAIIPYIVYDGTTSTVFANFSWPFVLGNLITSFVYDSYSPFTGDRTLYGRIKQLQEVLASDDDLALKNANKANEEAVKSDFVSGSSSKTSLGASDFGNLKDVGGTFNDLTSLNGQAKVSSFLSGLSSADEVGQGWFSEACRASLDAVSQPASSGTRLVQKTWRGEKSLIYTLEADTSVVGVKSVAGVVCSDLDPYNMGNFQEAYQWLWGDASW